MCQAILLRGSRLVILVAVRDRVLELAHEGHQGVNRCKARARDSAWWPGINGEITSRVALCERCAMTSVQHKEPLMSTELPSRPWEVVGADVFHLDRLEFIVAVDYYSRCPEVLNLTNTSSAAVIEALMSIFARHEIPTVVRSDNGPRFSSSEFLRFPHNYGFQNRTSSPRFSQSNGAAERAVRTCKELLKKAGDPHLALLNYRDTLLVAAPSATPARAPSEDTGATSGRPAAASSAFCKRCEGYGITSTELSKDVSTIGATGLEHYPR